MAKDKINQWIDRISGEAGNIDPAMHTGSESLSELWNPEEETVPTVQPHDLGHALIKANAIDAALLDRAKTIASQTPGKALADIFHDIGVDESAVQAAVASVNEMDFKRFVTVDVNLERLGQLSNFPAGFDRYPGLQIARANAPRRLHRGLQRTHHGLRYGERHYDRHPKRKPK